MKLHRIDLEGFGPFRDRQTVDFDAFDADGLFLITGRTGAGKSSILDGVCYALYGTAPRYDGGDRGLRSDHAEPDEATMVRLEFTAAGRRWRVTRAPEYERPKARGAGTTVQKSTVLVEELADEVWHGRATKYREAAEILDEILGLTRDQFQQVILLAQNRFAEFLLAKNDERQALLRTLFGSLRYEEYEREVDRLRCDARAALEGDSATLDALLVHAEALVRDNALDGAPAEPDDEATTTAAQRVEAVCRAVPRARYRAEGSGRRRDDAQAAHDAALTHYSAQKALRERQERRLASRRALAALEERAPQVDADRVRLERSAAAEALRSPLGAAERATAAVARAVEREARARATWVERVGADTAAATEPDDAAALAAVVDELSGDLAIWAAAAEHESAVPALADAVRLADTAIDGLRDETEQLREVAARRATRLAELEPEIRALEAAAPAVEPARDTLATVTTRLEAGREAEQLAPLAHAAEAEHLEATRSLEQRTAAVRALLQRRLDGYAGELAAALVDDEPCAVCGAIEHPHPAVPAGDPVTDEAVAEAEAAVELASATATAASAAARAARAAHHDALARAGGSSVVDLEAAHRAAEERLAAAEAAATTIATLAAEVRELREIEAAMGDEQAALAARLAAAKEDRAARAERLTAATRAVAAARGDHPSVAARIDEATRVRDAARALTLAIDDRLRAEQVAADAQRDLEERLAESTFDDAASVGTALLDTAVRERLASDLHRHDVDVATERERLLALETELAGASDEPVDLAPVAEAASLAREAWNSAVTEAARDTEVAARLAEAAERATRAHAASAEREAEHEIIAGLADALAGRTDTRMDLETFVLAAELEQIVDAANLRLEVMSSGRYRLEHSDAVGRHRAASGLGLAVFDSYTSQSRPTTSLSGGETFLASLALALGLAEVVTARSGGVRLDTLFIDEGFGSLDDETLELAMRTLDELRQGGRTVGLISHVAAMKEQLPAQLRVEATPQGPSIILQDSAVPAA
ncbi:AAA family ATPase [Microbacterium sp. NPDC055442]